jgi:hypothetical protein
MAGELAIGLCQASSHVPRFPIKSNGRGKVKGLDSLDSRLQFDFVI